MRNKFNYITCCKPGCCCNFHFSLQLVLLQLALVVSSYYRFSNKPFLCLDGVLNQFFEFISSGNGPVLGVYSVSKDALLNEKYLLQRSRIHGIRGGPYAEI